MQERKAIQTIMEHKIKTLVDNVAHAAGMLLGDAGASAATAPAAPAAQHLARELQALQRLVNASISALRCARGRPHRRRGAVAQLADARRKSDTEAPARGGSAGLASPSPIHGRSPVVRTAARP